MFFSEEPFLGLFFSETTERRLRQEEICQRIRFLMGGCVVSIALCRRGGENPGRNEEIRSETEGQCVGGRMLMRGGVLAASSWSGWRGECCRRRGGRRGLSCASGTRGRKSDATQQYTRTKTKEIGVLQQKMMSGASPFIISTYIRLFAVESV